jgi:hypothetical protein
MSDKRGPLASLAAQDEIIPTEANKTEFTMKLRELQYWNRLSVEDLSLNKINEARSSQFLQEFQGRLKRKRYIDNATKGDYEVRAVLRSLRCFRPPDFRCSKCLQALSFCSTITLPSFFESVIPPPIETDMSELDWVTENELFHYCCLLCGLQLRSKANYEKNKESQVRALLLEFLAVQSIEDVECALSVNRFSCYHGYI